MTNIDVATSVCGLLDKLHPRSAKVSHSSLIQFVKDRPGHDRRYAVDIGKIEQELGWQPEETFLGGLEKTVHWYLNNAAWIDNVTGGKYGEWIRKNYDQRVTTQ